MIPKTPANVSAVFDAYPEQIATRLRRMREMIFEVASDDVRIGNIEETLKWGQPSYLPSKTKSGTTVRIDSSGKASGNCSIFVHCGTSLVSHWREMFESNAAFEGNRAIIFDNSAPLPEDIVAQCIAMALTYRLK